MHYVIIEPGDLRPVDGETFTSAAELYRYLNYVSREAEVFAFDMSEAWRDGATSFRKVTEDVVREGVEAGITERDCPIAEAILGEPSPRWRKRHSRISMMEAVS